eukprot:GEMP01121798.1.p1 GENE.GEMP01121798.1~~GEMP01121798.1.p1  ORF type:complete len:105 (-),score=9.16 GEMP01121798.1:36-350(-)
MPWYGHFLRIFCWGGFYWTFFGGYIFWERERQFQQVVKNHIGVRPFWCLVHPRDSLSAGESHRTVECNTARLAQPRPAAPLNERAEERNARRIYIFNICIFCSN